MMLQKLASFNCNDVKSYQNWLKTAPQQFK